MANSLRMPMASSSLPRSSPSSSSGMNRTRRHRMAPVNAFKLPPVNPNDSFISKLASIAATSPEILIDRPKNPDLPPYMDLFDDGPQLMAMPGQSERASENRKPRTRTPPPDLPSLLLDRRIVYIGMPLVPAVTELIIAELLYLNWVDPHETIYIYLNSTGTTRDDGERVSMETEGFAVYDTLSQMKNEVQTLCIGAAVGQACLLLAAGNKGQRFMLPMAKAMIQQPRFPPSGLMPASDVSIRSREVIVNRNTLVELFAKHTGNTIEWVAEKMKRPLYMNAVKAKEFGVIDKILWRGQEQLMVDVAPPEHWDKDAQTKFGAS